MFSFCPFVFAQKIYLIFQTQGNFESFRLYLLSSQEWWRKPLKVCSHKNPGFNSHQILSALSHRRYLQEHKVSHYGTPIDDHCHQNRRSEPRWRRWQFASLGHFVFLFLLKRKTNPLFKIKIKTKANTAFPALKPRSMMIRMTKMT